MQLSTIARSMRRRKLVEGVDYKISDIDGVAVMVVYDVTAARAFAAEGVEGVDYEIHDVGGVAVIVVYGAAEPVVLTDDGEPAPALDEVPVNGKPYTLAHAIRGPPRRTRSFKRRKSTRHRRTFFRRASVRIAITRGALQ